MILTNTHRIVFKQFCSNEGDGFNMLGLKFITNGPTYIYLTLFEFPRKEFCEGLLRLLYLLKPNVASLANTLEVSP
jgi:hypothetical protein